ncbi:hypothetical protein C8R44DRAFT_733319 [Mycena epipterygia]|nr:hypothetical protein C8R44DRAFT_733319 [Mycena epipterygia]
MSPAVCGFELKEREVWKSRLYLYQKCPKYVYKEHRGMSSSYLEVWDVYTPVHVDERARQEGSKGCEQNCNEKEAVSLYNALTNPKTAGIVANNNEQDLSHFDAQGGVYVPGRTVYGTENGADKNLMYEGIAFITSGFIPVHQPECSRLRFKCKYRDLKWGYWKVLVHASQALGDEPQSLQECITFALVPDILSLDISYGRNVFGVFLDCSIIMMGWPVRDTKSPHTDEESMG